MSFKAIQIVCGDVNGKVFPKKTTLGDYAAALLAIPPKLEVYIEDPDYDVQTLNSSLSFRAVILGGGDGSFKAVRIDWTQPLRHKLDPTGRFWERGDGVGIRFPISDGVTPGTNYICIQFVP